jgi:hypothetical protein
MAIEKADDALRDTLQEMENEAIDAVKTLDESASEAA